LRKRYSFSSARRAAQRIDSAMRVRYKPRIRIESITMSNAAGAEDFKSWMCVLCGFMYDEAEGLPEEGIAPGTRWADVPEAFGCPDCSAVKADFEMIQV
jgi:rubredoxin